MIGADAGPRGPACMPAIDRNHGGEMAGSDLYVGTLDLLILRAVAKGPLHGYGIGRWIRESTDSVLDVQEGVLYPALHRLAKFYRLTRAGRRQLKVETERWERHIAAVNAALTYEEG